MITAGIITIVLILAFLYLAAEIHREQRLNKMYEAIQALSNNKIEEKDEQILLYCKYVIEQFRQNKKPNAYSEWQEKK